VRASALVFALFNAACFAHRHDTADADADADAGYGTADADDDDPCMVWEHEDGSWRTDFPPPDDFDGFENGHFGKHDYWRELSTIEDRLNCAGFAAENVAALASAAAARDRYFAECRETAEAQGLDIDSFANECV
jgi:hypothetical protein